MVASSRISLIGLLLACSTFSRGDCSVCRSGCSVVQQGEFRSQRPELPSGVYLSWTPENPGETAARGKEPRPNAELWGLTVQAAFPRQRPSRLGAHHEHMLIADAMRNDRHVQRLLLAEHGWAPQALAPRTHDRHGEPPLVTLRHSRRRGGSTTIGPFPEAIAGKSPSVALRGHGLAQGGLRRY